MEIKTFFPPNSHHQGKTGQDELNWIELGWSGLFEKHVEPIQSTHVSSASE